MAIRTARSAFVAALSAALVLGACQRDADAPAPDSPPPVAAGDARAPGSATAEAIDATSVVDHAPVAGAGRDFDVRAFAGTFVAEGARLALAPDGTYALSVDAGDADMPQDGSGTWSVEAGGTRIRLDPDSKDAVDRVYSIESSDELAAVDGGQVLRRDGA